MRLLLLLVACRPGTLGHCLVGAAAAMPEHRALWLRIRLILVVLLLHLRPLQLLLARIWLLLRASTRRERSLHSSNPALCWGRRRLLLLLRLIVTAGPGAVQLASS
jgi:hypothetical protein